MVVIPLATAAIALFFALTLFDQFLERRRPYQAVWSVGMALYGVASLLQGLWQLGATHAVVFRLWYLTGGMLVAAYLGVGTVYLHAPRRVAHSVFGVLLALTALGIALIFTTPFQEGADLDNLRGHALASMDPQSRVRYFPSLVGGLTAFLNAVGSLALIGGAAYSALMFARRRQAGYRVVSNVLIALGAFLSAAGGTLERFGLPQSHTLVLLIGIVVIYAGFLRSREVITVFRIPFAKRVPPRAVS